MVNNKKADFVIEPPMTFSTHIESKKVTVVLKYSIWVEYFSPGLNYNYSAVITVIKLDNAPNKYSNYKNIFRYLYFATMKLIFG